MSFAANKRDRYSSSLAYHISQFSSVFRDPKMPFSHRDYFANTSKPALDTRGIQRMTKMPRPAERVLKYHGGLLALFLFICAVLLVSNSKTTTFLSTEMKSQMEVEDSAACPRPEYTDRDFPTSKGEPHFWGNDSTRDLVEIPLQQYTPNTTIHQSSSSSFPWKQNSSVKVVFADHRFSLTMQEYVAQNDLLKFLWKALHRPAIFEAVLAVAIHAMGIPLISACSHWLGPYGLALWTMRKRFVGLGRLVKYGQKSTKVMVSSASAIRRGGRIARRGVIALGKTGSATTRAAAQRSTHALVKVWNASKRAIRHIYKKRARYSVASELTNFVPPEPKESSRNSEAPKAAPVL